MFAFFQANAQIDAKKFEQQLKEIITNPLNNFDNIKTGNDITDKSGSNEIYLAKQNLVGFKNCTIEIYDKQNERIPNFIAETFDSIAYKKSDLIEIIDKIKFQYPYKKYDDTVETERTIEYDFAGKCANIILYTPTKKNSLRMLVKKMDKDFHDKQLESIAKVALTDQENLKDETAKKQQITSYNFTHKKIMKLLDFDGNNDTLWLYDGLIIARLNNYEGAFKCFENALQINPKYYECYKFRGILKFYSGNKIDGCKDLFFAASNNNVEAKLKLEELGCNDNETIKAIKIILQQAADLINKQKFDEARVLYENAIKLDPNYAPTYTNLGTAEAIANNFEKAIINLNKAIKLDSKDLKNYETLISIYFNQKDYKNTIATIEKSFANGSKNYSNYIVSAIAKFELNDKAGCCKDLNFAKYYNVNNIDAYRSKYGCN